MHSYVLIAVMAFATIAIRFLPFVIFKKKTPDFIVHLGKLLPGCAMAMLVVYCLRNTTLKLNSILPSLVGITIVYVTYKWKHNTGLSILLATVIYMIMVQRIF